MGSAYDVDWAEFPPAFNDLFFPDRVAPAIEALKTIHAEAECGPPYMTLLYTIANNHRGSLYPASLAAIPLIGEILETPGWPRRTAFDVLVEIAYFDVQPTFEFRGQIVDFRTAAAEVFESIRASAEAIAAGPDDGADSHRAAQAYLEALKERATHL